MCNSVLVGFGSGLIAVTGFGLAILFLAIAGLGMFVVPRKAREKEFTGGDVIAIVLFMGAAFFVAGLTTGLLRSIG